MCIPPLIHATIYTVHELTVSYDIPYTCQFASPDMVRAFIDGERELSSDPNWHLYGATSADEYAYWALRSCGVVCVKMVVEGIIGQPTGTVMDWVRAGLALDGYLVELRPDRTDRPVEKGWKHSTLAQLAAAWGCQAELAANLDLTDLVNHICADRVVIASVSSELGEEGPVTRRSGHLVVAYGVVLERQGEVGYVLVHNPSGRSTALQRAARIPATRFVEGFSGRAIIVSGRE